MQVDYRKAVVVLLILLLGLVACAAPAPEAGDNAVGGEDVVEAPQVETPTEETAQEEPAEEEAMADSCTVRLGAAISETGRFSREGQWNQRGYDLWLDWVNNEYGGIQVGDQRCMAEMVYYDDESDPDTSARIYERLINEDKVDFLLGPYSSGITMGTSAIAEQYGRIMVEAHGASEGLFERDFENLFAVLTPASYYTKSAIEEMAAAGAKTMVIAQLDDEFSYRAAAGAQQWAEDNGIEVLALEVYPPESADLTPLLTRFRELEPDIFIGAGHFNDSVLFVRNAQEIGFEPEAMMLTVGPDSPEYVEEVGAASHAIIGDSQWDRTMTYEDQWFGTAEDYAQRFEAEYGEVPAYQSASSTAAALALHMAIEQAGSLEQDAVREALRNLELNTFYGPINFDETGANTAKPMVAVQIQDGEIVVVGPSDFATGELLYPMPGWEGR